MKHWIIRSLYNSEKLFQVLFFCFIPNNNNNNFLYLSIIKFVLLTLSIISLTFLSWKTRKSSLKWKERRILKIKKYFCSTVIEREGKSEHEKKFLFPWRNLSLKVRERERIWKHTLSAGRGCRAERRKCRIWFSSSRRTVTLWNVEVRSCRGSNTEILFDPKCNFRLEWTFTSEIIVGMSRRFNPVEVRSNRVSGSDSA